MSRHLHLHPDTTAKVFIGGREVDLTRESDFVWDLSGALVDPTMWFTNQPNDLLGQDHMCLKAARNGLQDCRGSENFMFLCEIPADCLAKCRVK